MSYKYTKISDLIKELEEIQKSHGDIPVCTSGDYGWTASVYSDVQPYYYDGGYYVQDGMGQNGEPNFISSRRMDLNDSKNKDLSYVVKLKSFYLDYDTNINGKTIRDINPGEFVFLDEIEQKTLKDFAGEMPEFKNTKHKNANGYYMIEAFLKNGLSAYGISRKEAQEALAKKFLLEDPNILLKEKL